MNSFGDKNSKTSALQIYLCDSFVVRLRFEICALIFDINSDRKDIDFYTVRN